MRNRQRARTLLAMLYDPDTADALLERIWSRLPACRDGADPADFVETVLEPLIHLLPVYVGCTGQNVSK